MNANNATIIGTENSKVNALVEAKIAKLMLSDVVIAIFWKVWSKYLKKLLSINFALID